MPTNYPGGLDNWTNPTANTSMDAVGFEHDILHSNAIDALEAIEAELGTDPRGNLATVKARLELLQRGTTTLAVRTGTWLSPFVNNIFTGTATQTANRLVLTALWVPVQLTFDRIGVQVSTAVDPSTIRLGVYNSTAAYEPSALLLDAGTVNSATTGAKEIVISLTLTAGLYYVALVTGQAPAVSSLGSGGGRATLAHTAVSGNPFGAFIATDAAYPSALPNPFPANASGQATALLVQLRIA